MKFVIVTGMSGAGKTTALKILEDLGFFCVDNLPVELIVKFAELTYAGEDRFGNVAIGIDARSGGGLKDLGSLLRRDGLAPYPYEILYLDAGDACLIKRFKETRRNHPLSREGRLIDGIREERELLKELRGRATHIIDTSHLLTRDLREELERIYVEGKAYHSLNVSILSFGFKYGIPQDADLLFDVRFLPNPFYIDELRPLTGNDAPVKDYVMSFPVTHVFLDKLIDMVQFLLPHYAVEGKNQLVIGIGCTGGKHRSVTVANALYGALEGKGYGITIEHKDILNRKQG